MSSHIVVTKTVTCDGPAVAPGAACGPATLTSAADHVTFYHLRHVGTRQGWTRRHHDDGQIDLCPDCTAANPVLLPGPGTIGRPVRR